MFKLSLNFFSNYMLIKITLDDDDDAVINEQSNSDVQDKNITDDNFEEDLVNFKSLPDTKKIPCEQKPNKEHKSTESSPETYCK